MRSAIKQIASGRFGVTSNYLGESELARTIHLSSS